MHELLGIIFGLAIGAGISATRPRRLRAAAVLPALATAGLLTSAVNGELDSNLAAAFVAADTLLVALGFVLGAGLGIGWLWRSARKSATAPASAGSLPSTGA
jgi:hypothetical protein